MSPERRYRNEEKWWALQTLYRTMSLDIECKQIDWSNWIVWQ